MKLIRTEDAVGSVLCHDITQIIPGVVKDAVFRKGHVVTEEDVLISFILSSPFLSPSLCGMHVSGIPQFLFTRATSQSPCLHETLATAAIT